MKSSPNPSRISFTPLWISKTHKYMLRTTVSDINGLHGIHDVKVDYHCFKGSPDDYKEYTEYPDCDVYHDAFDSAKERKQFMDENHPSEI